MSLLSLPSDLVILFALEIEAAGLIDRMASAEKTQGAGFKVWRGTVAHEKKSLPLIVAASGVGRANAARAAQAMIDAHRPAAIISAGFAGALDPRLALFDLLIANSLIDAEGRATEIDPALLSRWIGEHSSFHVGRLLTVDAIVRTAQQKQSLGREHSALAVDMETSAVASVCQDRNIKFLSARIISDTAGEDLPADLEHLMSQKTFAGQAGAALSSIFRRPGAIKEMFQLHQRAVEASDRLAKFLLRVAEGLEY